MCYGLLGASADSVQDVVDQVVVGYLGIDIESIYVVQVCLNSTCLLKITDLVNSPIRLVVVAIIFPNDILDLPSSSIPVPISFPLCQYFTFRI